MAQSINPKGCDYCKHFYTIKWLGIDMGLMSFNKWLGYCKVQKKRMSNLSLDYKLCAIYDEIDKDKLPARYLGDLKKVDPDKWLSEIAG